jgi:hypothetical protein
MMKLLIIVVLFIVGAVQAQTPPPKIQTTPVYITTGKDNYLISDITTTTEFPTMPTHCGGTLHEGVLSAGLTIYNIPDVPVQTTQPKCKVKITGKLKVGTMTWVACSRNYNDMTPDGSMPATSCNPEALQFTVVQGTAPTPTPLGAPTNLKGP